MLPCVLFRAQEPRIWELKLPFPNFPSPDRSPQAQLWAGWAFQAKCLGCAMVCTHSIC